MQNDWGYPEQPSNTPKNTGQVLTELRVKKPELRWILQPCRAEAWSLTVSMPHGGSSAHEAERNGDRKRGRWGGGLVRGSPAGWQKARKLPAASTKDPALWAPVPRTQKVPSLITTNFHSKEVPNPSQCHRCADENQPGFWSLNCSHFRLHGSIPRRPCKGATALAACLSLPSTCS